MQAKTTMSIGFLIAVAGRSKSMLEYTQVWDISDFCVSNKLNVWSSKNGIGLQLQSMQRGFCWRQIGRIRKSLSAQMKVSYSTKCISNTSLSIFYILDTFLGLAALWTPSATKRKYQILTAPKRISWYALYAGGRVFIEWALVLVVPSMQWQ